MRLFTFSIIAISISFSSCKKQKTLVENIKHYPKKIINYNSENQLLEGDYTIYTYNENNLLVRKTYRNESNSPPIVISSSYTYEYNSDNNVIKSYEDEFFRFYLTYEYNSNKRIKKVTSYEKDYNDNFEIESWQTFEYDESGRLIRINSFTGMGFNDSYKIYEYDNKQNITKIVGYKIFDNNISKVTEDNYIYDNKNSISNNISTPKIGIDISNNNIIQKEYNYFDEDGNITFTQTFSYTYEYNDHNYPIKKTYNSGNYSLYEYNSIENK